MKDTTQRMLAGLALAAAWTTGAAGMAQDGKDERMQEEERKLDESLLPPGLLGGGEDSLQKELRELFHQVERSLVEVDVQLSDAGAGVVPLGEVADSGIDDLLRSTSETSDRIVRDIDRILEIAQQLGGTSMGSASSQPPQPGGESPLDEERDRGPTEREDTPDTPAGQEERPSQPEPGETPRGDDRNPLEGENRPDAPDQHASDSPASTEDDAERWGQLPVRLREIFRNQGTDDLPVQYRDWIDAYYRRLSRQR